MTRAQIANSGNADYGGMVPAAMQDGVSYRKHYRRLLECWGHTTRFAPPTSVLAIDLIYESRR